MPDPDSAPLPFEPSPPRAAPPLPPVPLNEDYPVRKDVPPVAQHPLARSLDEHFPDDPGHPGDSLYARTRRMFEAVIDAIKAS